MKTRAKVGGKAGNPGYRTPSRFIAHRSMDAQRGRFLSSKLKNKYGSQPHQH